MKKKIVIILISLFIATSSFAAAKAAPKKAPLKAKTAITKPKPKKAPVAPAAPVVPAEWAAKVNDDYVTMDLYSKRLEAAIKQITKEISLEAAEEKGLIKTTRRSILEQMIEAVILLQWADREGMQVNDKTIKARIQELKKTFPSAKEFHRSLAEQGMSVADLERDIKKQLIIDKIINMRIKALAVTDEEIKAFYDKNIDLYAQKEKLQLSQIVFKDFGDAEMEKSKLNARKEFVGEDIGLVESEQLPIDSDTGITSLKPGEISDIISGEAGFYIFKVINKAPAREISYEDAKDNIRKFLLREKARTQYMKDLLDEKTSAKILINEKLEKLF